MTNEFPLVERPTGRATSRSPQALTTAGRPQGAGVGQSPAPAYTKLEQGHESEGLEVQKVATSPLVVTRIFRAEMRRPKKNDEQAAAIHTDILKRLRTVSALCAQFGNEVLTANYLLYRHKADKDGRLEDALSQEALLAEGRYKAWGDRISSYARDAISRRITGLIRSKGREVLRGESSLPTFLRRGSILVRERGFKLWREEGRLYCSIKAEPGPPIELELWVKGYKDYYGKVLEKLLSGEYSIGQAQVLIVQGYKVSVRIAYSFEVEPATGTQHAEIINTETGFTLKIGDREYPFGFDVIEAARRKATIDARRVQCWRILRGRRIKARRARIYKSGTLTHLSQAWNDYQRTWSQQLAAVVIGKAVAERCGSVTIPSPQTLASWFVSELDWTLVHGSLMNLAERHGLKVVEIRTENEQKRDTRKLERAEKKKAQKEHVQ